MMRSMFSGVSGLKVHQTKMDVIGNNIANVNTVGYKSQRVTFSDVFSQTLQGATSANDDTGRGGVNAMQVGLGVNVSSIDMLMTQGAAQRTDNPFDLMINGDGFMVVGDSSGTYFTRAGALRQDDDGNLVISNGMKVQGWLSSYDDTTNKYVINQQEVQSINLADPTIQSANPTMTTKAQVTGNICNTDTTAATTLTFYDSLGNPYTLGMTLTKADANTWDITVADVITDAKGNEIAVDDISVDTDSLEFDTNGKLITPTDGDIQIKFSGNDTTELETGSVISNLTVSLTGLTQYATKSDLDSKTVNGNSAGTLSGYSIGTDGIITATYSNGDKRPIAQVVVASFENQAGLEKVGDNLYATTTNSGEFDGVGATGTFNTGVLEMSNVDLAAEFTDMIITQRGFQANSRIITVSDEMLQELTNLK